MLNGAIRRYGLSLKTAFVETDYTNTSSSADNAFDFHFLPDAMLAPPLIAAGISADSLVVSGIPVRQAFYEKTEKSAAKRHLGIDPARKHVIVMGGSMGGGPLEELAAALCAELSPEVEISVVCGTNKRLYRQLCARRAQFRNLRVCGYESNVPLLMDSADLLITKPGGINVTEAAVKALPMLLIHAVAGWESHNRDYFLQNGGAVTGASIAEQCRLCRRLLADEQTLLKMSDALRPFAERHSADIIYAAMSGLERADSDAE